MASLAVWIAVLLAISAVQLAVGIAVGGRLRGQVRPGTTNDAIAVQAALRELESLTTRVDEQVTEHTQRVGAIHEELSSTAGQTGAEREATLNHAASRMLDATEQLKAELAAARAELAAQTERLAIQTREARTDGLTALVNRRAFDEELQRRFAQFRRQHGALSMLLIDVDHFKKFNDTHGHQAGDEVLRQVARTLAVTMRDMDIVARYGGEEFAVILPGTDLANGKVAAQRARAAIEAAVIPHAGATLKVTASIGLSQALPGDDPKSLIERADQALYAAKKGGRNRGYYHNGRESLAIVAEQAPHKPAPAEFTLDESPLAASSAKPSRLVPHDERRRHGRREMRATQLIAPYVYGRIPTPNMFREVPCEDVSASGFSFYSDEPLDAKDLVVEFGVSPHLMYVSAKVVHCTPVGTKDEPRFKVGCRFVGRLQM